MGRKGEINRIQHLSRAIKANTTPTRSNTIWLPKHTCLSFSFSFLAAGETLNAILQHGQNTLSGYKDFIFYSISYHLRNDSYQK
jgi:hypothetical protein